AKNVIGARWNGDIRLEIARKRRLEIFDFAKSVTDGDARIIDEKGAIGNAKVFARLAGDSFHIKLIRRERLNTPRLEDNKISPMWLASQKRPSFHHDVIST